MDIGCVGPCSGRPAALLLRTSAGEFSWPSLGTAPSGVDTARTSASPTGLEAWTGRYRLDPGKSGERWLWRSIPASGRGRRRRSASGCSGYSRPFCSSCLSPSLHAPRRSSTGGVRRPLMHRSFDRPRQPRRHGRQLQGFITAVGAQTYGIAVDAKHIYWAACPGAPPGVGCATQAIVRANLDGTDADDSFIRRPRPPHNRHRRRRPDHVYWRPRGARPWSPAPTSTAAASIGASSRGRPSASTRGGRGRRRPRLLGENSGMERLAAPISTARTSSGASSPSPAQASRGTSRSTPNTSTGPELLELIGRASLDGIERRAGLHQHRVGQAE